MAKLNPKAVLKPAVSLFLICLIVTALLAGGMGVGFLVNLWCYLLGGQIM